MRLARAQIEEIAAFDWRRRTGRDFDGRRYGSVTGDGVPRFTEAWVPCHGSDVFKGAKAPRKTLRYNYIVRAKARRSEGRPDVTVLHVAVRLDGAYRQVMKVVAKSAIGAGTLQFRDIGYHGIGGWIVEWQKEDWAGGRGTGNGQRGTVRLAKPVDRDWSVSVEWKFHIGLTFPYHETINVEALKGTKYEYCQYQDELRCRAGLVDWLMLYRQEPKVELLAKMGLYTLICPAGIKALKDRKIRDWVIANRDMLAKRDKFCDVAEILYAARHGETITEAQKRLTFVHEMKRRLEEARYRAWQAKVKLKMDYDRLRKLMGKWKCDKAEYGRYLELAIASGMDPRNEGTLYPPTKGGREAFMVRLEALEAEAERRRRAEERRRRRELKANQEAEAKRMAELMATRMKELKAFQASVERCKTLKGCGYTLLLAKSQEELLAEGKKMGNCVGMGMYGNGIALGDRLIVMVKVGKKSYCDIEIERKHWTVKQCYLKHNERAPEEMQKLAEAIASTLKAAWRRLRKAG